MFDARQIANEVLKRAWQQDLEITQLQLYKIVYFLHGHHLKTFEKPLVKTEFQAWQFGPVHTALRSAFKDYGDEPIETLAKRFNPVTREEMELPALTDNQALTTIDTYLDQYLELPAGKLVDMTHAKGTPWFETMRAAQETINIGMKIFDSLISQKFEGIEKA